MSSLKIVVFPGPEGVAYTTEKRTVPTNPMMDFLSDRSSTRTHEQIYTIKQITHGHLEAQDKRKTTRLHGRQLVCPPILDLAMNKRWEQHPAHKHRRIINGFFPSKIRTSTNNGALKDPTKDIKQEVFDEVLPVDPPSVPHQNGAFLSRTGSKHSQLSEPAVWRTSGQQQHEDLVHSGGRRAPLSLRNGSPSPWINRYQLKKKSISACNNSQSVTRKFSR